MLYAGADISKRNWFTVALTGGNNWEVNLFESIERLWYQYNKASLILIDIPIGLRDGGSKWRLCDIEAREHIKHRRNSVFRAPCRAAILAETHEEASKVNKQITGKGLSIQTWGIIPKIKEVDRFLTQNIDARDIIHEIHPEVCFWALNNRKPMIFNKKDKRGIQERKEVLLSVYPTSRDIFDYAERRYLRKEVARDDILDAIVAAVTASKQGQKLLTIPASPELDSKGLSMEMIYYSSP